MIKVFDHVLIDLDSEEMVHIHRVLYFSCQFKCDILRNFHNVLIAFSIVHSFHNIN